MAMLFMGGEDIDFDRFINGVALATDGNSYRSAFARCSILVPGGGGEMSAYAAGHFTAPATNFWVTGRVLLPVQSQYNATPKGLIAVTAAGSAALTVQAKPDLTLQLVNAAGTVLATSAQPALSSAGGLQRIDVQVVYAVQGRVRVFVNQVPYIDFSGDVTSATVTALDGLWLGSPLYTQFTGVFWSEIIAATRDTRTLSLKTHAPVATAAGHAWLGNQTDVGEIALDESTMITTDQVNQPAKFTVSPLPPGNFAVQAFKVATWAARGGTGPAHIDLGVNVGNTDFYSPDQSLDTGFAAVSQIYDYNPVTNQTWSVNDIASIEIIAKSKT